MNQLKKNWNNYWHYNGRLNRANLIKAPIHILCVIAVAIFFGLGFIAARLTGLMIDGYASQKDKEDAELTVGLLFGMGQCIVIIFYLNNIGVLNWK